MKNIPLSPLFCIVLMSVFLCWTTSTHAVPLPVVVSIMPQKYMLERIAPGAVSVDVLVKPGADPHSYEPSPSQMRAVGAARVWFTIGVPFEDVWLPRIASANNELAIISSITGIKRLHFGDMHGVDGKQGLAEETHNESLDSDTAHVHHQGEDPHVWLSPMMVRRMLPHLARELGKLMPDRAAEFRKNGRAFAEELEALDVEIADRFLEIPESRRIFLTFHPSWRYFAANYQLTELSIEMEGKEPGPKSMKRVIDLAREHDITTIFIEPQFPKTTATAIAESLGAELVEADPLTEDLPALYRGMADKLIKSFSH